MARLRECIERLNERWQLEGNRLFYLATPPDVFDDLVIGIREGGLNKSAGWVRIVVKKPFGHDLESARQLNRLLWTAFDEPAIFRIDHYLGKETVQNLLVFRFGNTIFEPLWNRRYIDHVQITVAESDGVGHRGRYYDAAGALRDMVPNHLFQLLTLVAMEPPIALDADAVRDEKLRVLRSLKPFEPDEVDQCVVRGAIRCGRDKWGEGARLSRRTLRSPAISDGDFRRLALVRAQLALGGRALLPADGQAVAQTRHRSAHPISSRPAFAVPARNGGATEAQFADAAHPT
jgi:glucose-6-phosphate 1-dehydrogenase